MEIIGQGTCQFKVVKDISKKSGNEYKCLKLIFRDYELSTPVFITEDQLFLIKDRLGTKAQ